MTMVDMPDEPDQLVHHRWMIWNITDGVAYFTVEPNCYGNRVKLFESWEEADHYRIRWAKVVWISDDSEVRLYDPRVAELS